MVQQLDPDVMSIGLFIDIENLVRSAVEIGLPVDLEPILGKLVEQGRVTIRRAFGDLDAACDRNARLRGTIRVMMQENLVQFEDIPYITKHKNTADMRLCVEALSVAYTHPDVTCYAIVASDRDYMPLITKLKELGKSIIGVGVSPNVVELGNRLVGDRVGSASHFLSAGIRTSRPNQGDILDEALLKSANEFSKPLP